MNALLGRLLLSLFLILLGSIAQAEELLLKKTDIIQVLPSIWTANRLLLRESDKTLPIIGPGNTADGARLLRLYNAQGGINGFAGILYDNRDRGHSNLKQDRFPRLTHLKYDDLLTADGFDYGLAGRVLLPAVVLGNSSTALRRGVAPRSLPRLAMTTPFWQSATATLYANNHIYIYPEHRDYDDEDLFPVNWPYMIISQGSSRSDQLFLNAVAMTLAALSPDTFSFLRKKGLIAPTVQMILRSNLENVSTRADYFSGIAHPTAFYGPSVQTGRMVEHANKLRPENIPPVVRLRVVEEDFTDAAGLARMDERLFDTPAAIGRLWRGFVSEREMVVTAEDTSDPNNLPVTFNWQLLRGDPARVTIEPQDPDARTARIKIAWHDPWIESSPGKKGPVQRQASRVDIGVFANNGVHDSAPSFISIDFPEHQIRKYTSNADGGMRLLSIDYDAHGRGAYFDPLLYWTAQWSDTARYDKNGLLLGWERTSTDGVDTDFVPNDTDAETPLHEIIYNKKRSPSLRRVEN